MATCYNIRLKIAFIVEILFFIISPLHVNAQQNVPDIRVVVHDVRQEKDSIRVRIEIEANGLSVSPREQLYYFPVIRTEMNERKLLPVVVRGRTQQAVVNRMEKLSGDVEPVYDCFSVKRRELFHKKISYNSVVPFEQWMKKANVAMVHERRNCRGDFHRLSVEIIADSIRLAEKPVRTMVYILPVKIPVPPREEIKRRSETGEAQIIYRVGNAEINPGLGNNQDELDKIQKSITYIHNVREASINSVTISAYASPEGNWQSNLALSGRRAASLTGWLRRNYDLGGITLSSRGYGEDWDGLERLVREDPVMPAAEKENILGTIGKEDAFERRKMLLKQLRGGQTWHYLLTNLFPQLRRSAYRIDFTVPEYSIETIKEVYRTHPNMLSLYEFYLLANQYEPESRQFSDVIRKASTLYPDEKINRLSMAVFSYLSNDMEAALDYLRGLESDPDAWLYFAAFHARKAELEEAEKYIQRAAEAGNPDAAEQLELIGKYKTAEESYQEKLREWETFGTDP